MDTLQIESEGVHMSIDNQRLDITNRIVGKFDDGHLNLYLEKEKIGQMVSEYNYELKEGYDFNHSRFYQYTNIVSEPNQKDVNCKDENGWC